MLPVWFGFAIAGVVLATLVRRLASVGQALLAGAATWMAFVLASKQAFCNYYWLAVGMICAGVACLVSASTAARDA